MLSPENFSDYREILREELATRTQINPRYSLRAFARDVNLAPSRLSEILNGKQGLSREAAEKVAQLLGYSQNEREFFCDLVSCQHGRSQTERDVAKIRLQKHMSDANLLRLKNDTFHLISDWYHLAILELTTIVGFQSDEAWIARNLGITEHEVRLALERLERIGLIGRTNGKITALEGQTSTLAGAPSESIKKFYKQLLQKSIDAIYLQPVDKRDLSVMIMAVDTSKYAAAKERIKQFRREFCTEMSSAAESKDSVYCLAIQYFSLKGEDHENVPHGDA